MPVTVPGTAETAVTKVRKVPALLELPLWLGEKKIHVHQVTVKERKIKQGKGKREAQCRKKLPLFIRWVIKEVLSDKGTCEQRLERK